MPEISLHEDDQGWTDVILPDGALKSGMLKGLIGFQELNPTSVVNEPKNKPSNKKARKRTKAAILFDSEDPTESAEQPDEQINPSKVKKLERRKKRNEQKRKKKRKLVESEAKEEVEEEVKVVSNEEYEFVNKLAPWTRMNLARPLLRILDERSLLEPTEIQKETVPKGLNTKKDILAAAETGSGKTFAFGLPVVQKIHMYLEKYGDHEVEEEVNSEEVGAEDEAIFGGKRMKQGPLGLVLCPTRELAVQVHDQVKLLSTHTLVRTAVIIGGMSDDKQERILSKFKPHLIVATPGRFWELTRQGQSWLQSLELIKYLIIDEADRMAEKGHFAELGSIVDSIGPCQKFIFSATLTLTHKGSRRMEMKNVKADTSREKMAKLMKVVSVEKGNAEVIDLSNKTLTASNLSEFKVACANDKEKDAWLYWLLTQNKGRCIVFVNAISAALRLNGVLAPLNLPAHSLHSNMQQKARLKHMDRFKSNPNAILVSTDVAARGLDIPNVELIIHFQFPKTAETYVHRSGRAARAGASGEAVVLLGQGDNVNYKKVMNNLGKGDLAAWDANQPSRLIYDRLSLAVKIDRMAHEKKKETVEKNWFKKQAELCEIELSDDEGEGKSDPAQERQRAAQIDALRAQLNTLLRQRL